MSYLQNLLQKNPERGFQLINQFKKTCVGERCIGLLIYNLMLSNILKELGICIMNAIMFFIFYAIDNVVKQQALEKVYINIVILYIKKKKNDLHGKSFSIAMAR